VAVLGAARAGGEGKAPDGHDWLEVTALAPLDPCPVEVLLAPELVEPVELELVEPVELEGVEPAELEVVAPVELEVAAAGLADTVTDLRASAGSWPVTSTTVMSSHTAKNSATDPPITRARILRTRAWRACLNLSPSSLVMAHSIRLRRSNGV
jgi:hypothetical protein